MLYLIAKPTETWQPFIDCYWQSQFHFAKEPIYSELYQAQLCSNLIFNLEENYQRNGKEVTTSSLEINDCNPILYTHSTKNKLFGVRFKPFGYLPFLQNAELQAITGSTEIDLSYLWKADFEHTFQDILRATSFEERIIIVEKLLANKLKKANITKLNAAFKLFSGIRQLTQNTSKIENIASELCLTQRTLDRKSQELLGINPKKLHTLIRFNNAFDAMHQAQKNGVTFDFFQFGYYDQAHYIKEFKSYTGLSPTAYRDSSFFVHNLQANH